ncbi:MAG TPA: dihydrodipicolinate synthase family protein [Gaiellaceae bacterium]|nr:dihydrodipicolinate synthase family protein [Gaiellaceae bacterium]
MSSAQLRERLAGVTAVPVTPFVRGGKAIDHAALESLIGRIDSAGIQAITTLGATAEVFQLSSSERREVVRVAAATRANAALLAGLAGPLSELLELASFAAEQGVDAVMVHEPGDPGGSAGGLVALLHAVADESPLPVVPYLRTPRLAAAELHAVIDHPNVVAVKYAVPDLERASALMTSGGLAERTLWVCGLAELWVPAFAHLGIRGFTSGLANVEPALALALLAALERGDSAAVDELLALVIPFELLRNRDRGRHNVAVVKEALAAAGLAEPDLRPPAVRLDRSAQAELAAVLDRFASYLGERS